MATGDLAALNGRLKGGVDHVIEETEERSAGLHSLDLEHPPRLVFGAISRRRHLERRVGELDAPEAREGELRDAEAPPSRVTGHDLDILTQPIFGEGQQGEKEGHDHECEAVSEPLHERFQDAHQPSFFGAALAFSAFSAPL